MSTTPITDMLNSIGGLKHDIKDDWKENVKVDWKVDWQQPVAPVPPAVAPTPIP